MVEWSPETDPEPEQAVKGKSSGVNLPALRLAEERRTGRKERRRRFQEREKVRSGPGHQRSRCWRWAEESAQSRSGAATLRPRGMEEEIASMSKSRSISPLFEDETTDGAIQVGKLWIWTGGSNDRIPNPGRSDGAKLGSCCEAEEEEKTKKTLKRRKRGREGVGCESWGPLIWRRSKRSRTRRSTSEVKGAKHRINRRILLI